MEIRPENKEATTAFSQLQADRQLMNYKTYEEYLDSLVGPTDLCLLRSTVVARVIAELGYRSSGETLSRDKFYKRRAAVIEAIFPSRKPYELYSEGLPPTDPLQQELALRERSNRVGILATIIFIRCTTKRGFEISGYIDYLHRLKTENWLPFFEGKKKLKPQPTDLAYYHWRVGNSYCNSTRNFKVIIDPIKGLLFQNRHDRKMIFIDPNLQSPGSTTVRQRIYSDKYTHIVIFDQLVRRRS